VLKQFYLQSGANTPPEYPDQSPYRFCCRKAPLLQARQGSLITIHLSRKEAVNGHRPSVNVLFKSLSEVYKENCLAIIMTGMGKDGVKEIGTIYRQGGITIAQEASSCIVPGMPGTAIREGFIDEIVHLKDIARVINEKTAR
jgi:two-component system chemotaxis response regulator CheB